MTRPANVKVCCKCGDYGKWDEYAAYGRIDAYCPPCQPTHYEQLWEWSEDDE